MPRATAGAPPAEPAHEPAADRVATTATVLLVEDEAIVRQMVVVALERRGYRVIPVASGDAALEILTSSATIDVLSDVIMPGLGGPELLDRLASIRPGLPAVFMSGYTGLTLQRREFPAEVTVLEKPFTGARLDDAIRAAIGGAPGEVKSVGLVDL